MYLNRYIHKSGEWQELTEGAKRLPRVLNGKQRRLNPLAPLVEHQKPNSTKLVPKELKSPTLPRETLVTLASKATLLIEVAIGAM